MSAPARTKPRAALRALFRNRGAKYSLSSRGALCCAGTFLCARSTQYVRHAVVSFMAGVLKKRVFAFHHRDPRGPFPGERGGIVHRDFVSDHVGAGPREALG